MCRGSVMAADVAGRQRGGRHGTTHAPDACETCAFTVRAPTDKARPTHDTFGVPDGPSNNFRPSSSIFRRTRHDRIPGPPRRAVARPPPPPAARHREGRPARARERVAGYDAAPGGAGLRADA